MKKLASLAFSFLFIATAVMSQDAPKKRQKGHTDQNKFRQLKDKEANFFMCFRFV